MSTTSRLNRLPSERAMKARKLRRALGVLLVAALGAGILLARFCQREDVHADAMAQGVEALSQALVSPDDDAAWARAEVAFREGLRGSLFDAYPTFALTLTTRLRSGDLSDIEPALKPVAQALLAGDFDLATTRLVTAKGAAGYGWMLNLVHGLKESDPRVRNETR